MLKPAALALVFMFGMTEVAFAQTCSAVPHTFTTGSTALASDVMDNFNSTVNCINLSVAPLANPHFSGSVGIGTTAPLSPLGVMGQVVIGGPSHGDASLQINGSYGGFGRLTQIQASGISAAALNLMNSTDSSGSPQWFSWGVNNGVWTINPGTNFAYNTFTVDSANRVGVSTAAGGWFGASTFSVQSNSLWVSSMHATTGTGILLLRTDIPGLSYYAYMTNGTSMMGSITTTGSGVNYNTISDYRLKTNVIPLANPLDRVMQLKPVSYNWKAAPQQAKSDGFLAHEVAQVIPDAVTGQKDAVDKGGSIIAQQVDYSKLVPLLVAAVQAEQAEIIALKAQLAALKPGT